MDCRATSESSGRHERYSRVAGQEFFPIIVSTLAAIGEQLEPLNNKLETINASHRKRYKELKIVRNHDVHEHEKRSDDIVQRHWESK